MQISGTAYGFSPLAMRCNSRYTSSIAFRISPSKSVHENDSPATDHHPAIGYGDLVRGNPNFSLLVREPGHV